MLGVRGSRRPLRKSSEAYDSHGVERLVASVEPGPAFLNGLIKVFEQRFGSLEDRPLTFERIAGGFLHVFHSFVGYFETVQKTSDTSAMNN